MTNPAGPLSLRLQPQALDAGDLVFDPTPATWSMVDRHRRP